MKTELLNFGTFERVSLQTFQHPLSYYLPPVSFFLTVSMHLLYVLKCSQFFNTLDTDFFPADSPDNDDEEEEEGEESRGGARKHKIKHVSSLEVL